MRALLILLAVTMASCAHAQEGSCRADDAAALVGKAIPTEQEAMDATGAKSVRGGGPGSAMTMDYNPDRLTVIGENGIVLEARCG